VVAVFEAQLSKGSSQRSGARTAQAESQHFHRYCAAAFSSVDVSFVAGEDVGGGFRGEGLEGHCG